MQQKAFVLTNKGMNRDLSISKAGESSAYENHNIRILARENDTMLSVTNERGTQEIDLRNATGFLGTLIGWNVLNNHLILFTHEEGTPAVTGKPDHIYRVDYTNGDFVLVRGHNLDVSLFDGNLNFDSAYPIESVVYQETEAIQKIYWVDGRNVLRFMNFMASDMEIAGWDNTSFDSNKAANFDVTATISKDNSGNTRANGVAQYLLTYYNKHGQETGYIWVSDLVYLSPLDKGGAADGTNSNKVTINLSSEKVIKFTNYRVYSIFRSALNGTAVAYIVQDGEIKNNSITVIDDGAHLETEDIGRLLYLGSQGVIASTLTHKDQTLFLGDLKSIGKKNFSILEAAIKTMYDSNSGLSNSIAFRLSEGTGVICDIPYHADNGTYEYDSQLRYTSSQILSFKGGEKYRFALTFRKRDGSSTEAYWIGDAVNNIYPVIDINNNVIKRIVAYCTLPSAVITAMQSLDLSTAQLMIAEATYADRIVKAQGFINPTMFNVWERYNERLYSEASWISRPRRSIYAHKHFEPVHNSTVSTGEIECNYWGTTNAPRPYYRFDGTSYEDEFDGMPKCDVYMLLYRIHNTGARYEAKAWLVQGVNNTSDITTSGLLEYEFGALDQLYITTTNTTIEDPQGRFSISSIKTNEYSSTKTESVNNLYPLITGAILRTFNLPIDRIADQSRFNTWCEQVTKNNTYFFSMAIYQLPYGSMTAALNDAYGGESHPTSARWTYSTVQDDTTTPDYTPSYYRKHLMFVDENVITLNSPELEYEAVSFDKSENYKLRIVGVSRITSTSGDYTVDATPGKLPGENLINIRFVSSGSVAGHSGIISWPLWKEYGLIEKQQPTDDEEQDDSYIRIPDITQRTSEDYEWYGDTVSYWLHMWNHSGKINGYTDSDNSDYSRLISKVFANRRYSYNTIYNTVQSSGSDWLLSAGSLRLFNYTHSQYLGIDIGGKVQYYDANVNLSLLPAGTHKYPIIYSNDTPPTSSPTESDSAFLYLNSPVQIDYLSSPHAVIALPTTDALSSNSYSQVILPYISNGDRAGTISSNSICPWWGGAVQSYTSASYSFNQSQFTLSQDTTNGAGSLSDTDKYLFIGEIYDPNAMYGDISNTRFVTAGPQYTLGELNASNIMYANQGDTYFQRWDCLKTKPAAKTDVTNGVIDITSLMLETHINIDGRHDNQREMGYVASIDTEKYGQLNSVYTQQNNFFVQRDLDVDYNLDTYHSAITWTLDKADSAQIDEWTHITLANSLKLDGDKGICRALRRFQNSIIAFQDRGIAEVLFNSRTQLSTTDGVPVEIANSGKVDGKRYITNKYGCMNKWSIVEGKNGLYFIDNINKSFCAFTGQGIDPLSTRLGFDVWFRNAHRWDVWTPKKFENIVSYYDRIHSDVYLVTNEANGSPCLVYNENLGAFTSFFDYQGVPMMTNVEDRFVAFKGSKLWSMNTGLYCNFFGEQYDFWTWYRVTPDPYGDKIWSNIDYRADAYYILDENGNVNVPEQFIINADRFFFTSDLYKENDTFTSYRMWNEYQTTGDVQITVNNSYSDVARKKFRIWRIAVARALRHDTNQYGLDRIRNPWVNLMMKKHVTDNRELMQLHDVVVKYFE